MTTLRNVIRQVVCLIMIITILFLLNPVSRPNVAVQAENKVRSYSEYITQLLESRSKFYIGFNYPIEGDIGWDVPTDYIENDVIIGGKRVKEIGSDFICIEEWGQGLSVMYCIPFSNVNSIRAGSY